MGKFEKWHVDWAQIIDSYECKGNKVTIVYWPKGKPISVTHDKKKKAGTFVVKTAELQLVREKMQSFVNEHNR